MITLKSGREVEDANDPAIDEEGTLWVGDDSEMNVADYTPEERMELALVMVERWSRWADFPVEHMALAIEEREHRERLAAKDEERERDEALARAAKGRVTR